MGSLDKLNAGYMELLAKYVNTHEQYYKLEKRVTELERFLKYDVEKIITKQMGKISAPKSNKIKKQ